MSSDPQYVLDANIFVDAKNRYYAFDICPGFWKALLQEHKADRVWSIDRIEQELKDGNDELREWVEEHTPETFFDRTDDEDVIEVFAQIIDWVTNHSQYKPEAKDEFADAADGWLAAYAKVYGMTVVTHEGPSVSNSRPPGREFDGKCQQLSA